MAFSAGVLPFMKLGGASLFRSWRSQSSSAMLILPSPILYRSCRDRRLPLRVQALRLSKQGPEGPPQAHCVAVGDTVASIFFGSPCFIHSAIGTLLRDLRCRGGD